MRAWLPLLLILFVAPVQASSPTCAPIDCVPVIPPVDVPIIIGDVEVRAHRLDIHVVDGIATVQQTLVVENTGIADAELQANLPLEPGAAIMSFQLVIGGEVYEGRVAERAEAQAEYEQAQNESRDAILLSRQDDRLLSLRANVGPGEPRELRVSSVFQVPTSGGARLLRVPAGLLESVDETEVDVLIEDRYGFTDVSFPVAPMEVVDQTPQRVQARHQSSGPIDDVVVVWYEDTREWDLRALASHGGDDAALLLRLDHHPIGGEVLPRDVAFVIDVSGSMSGHKIEDAREAVATGLGMLRNDDRFTVHSFANDAHELSEGLEGQGSAASMQASVRELAAGGGTNLHEGLLAGLESLPEAPERAQAVILFSDGLPTAGVRNHDAILEDVLAAAHGTAVHVVAIGVDADRTFLRDVADHTGGSLTILQPHEGDLEARLAALLAQLDRPVARDVQITFEGITPRDMIPETVPLLYEGRTVSLLMRADLGITWSVRLTATNPAGPVDQSFTITPEDIELVPAVEQLWGAAYVETLLAKQRADPDADLEVQIIEAATTYGVVTPFTSWVVVGPPLPEPVIDGAAHAAGSPTGTTTSTATSSATHRIVHDAGDASDDAGDASTPGLGIVPLLAILFWVVRRR